MEKGAKSYTCSDTTFLPLKVQNSTERARIHTLYDSVGTLPCLCKYNSIGSLFYGHLKRLLHTYYITTITSYNRDTRGLLGLCFSAGKWIKRTRLLASNFINSARTMRKKLCKHYVCTRELFVNKLVRSRPPCVYYFAAKFHVHYVEGGAKGDLYPHVTCTIQYTFLI